MPILFSRTEKYDVARGGEFFQSMQFQLLLVARDAKSGAATPIYEDKKPKLIDLGQAAGFFEQTGRNTGYIIHPEEILADNFTLLVMQDRNVPSPGVIERMGKVLKGEETLESKLN